MKSLPIILMIFLFCHAPNHTRAQRVLTLNKPGMVNRIRYYEKNEISFKLRGEHIVHTGNITHLNDSSFLLNELYPIRVNDISMVIDYKKGYWARFLHRLTLTAGIMYYGIGTANRLIFKDSPPVFEGKFVLTSLAMVGGSFLFTPFTCRKYRINKNRYLKVLDVSIR